MREIEGKELEDFVKENKDEKLRFASLYKNSIEFQNGDMSICGEMYEKSEFLLNCSLVYLYSQIENPVVYINRDERME